MQKGGRFYEQPRSGCAFHHCGALQVRRRSPAVAYALFPLFDIPSAKWSFHNRLFMAFAGTQDARGICQWNRAGRTVIPGAKAFY